VVPAELVQQPLIVLVHQPARAQMPRHRSPNGSDATFKARELAVVIVVDMPQLEPFFQQRFQPGSEVASPSPLQRHDLIDRAQRVRDALLLLDPLQFLGVIALAPVGDQHPGIIVADDLTELLSIFVETGLCDFLAVE
jgi:hypothetical protein